MWGSQSWLQAGFQAALGELEESAKETLAHLKGENKLPTRLIVLPDRVNS